MRSIPLDAFGFSIPAIDCEVVECSADIPQESLATLNACIREAAEGQTVALMKLASWCTTGAVFINKLGQPSFTVITLSQEAAVCLWEAAAANGDIEACYQLGCAYETGHGVTADLPKALKEYSQAASAGHQVAAYNLAALEIQGNDQSRGAYGVDLLGRLASAGYKPAMLSYGAMHLPDFGPGWLKPDLVKALKWIDAAGSTGPSEVQHSLAILFNSGTENVPRDQARAIYLFEASAQQGHAHSQHIMGIFNLEKNPNAAIKWFEAAASSGFVDSQVNLALFYAKGQKVPQDAEQAYWWARIAESNGEAVSSLVSEVATQLSTEQIEELEMQVRRFVQNSQIASQKEDRK